MLHECKNSVDSINNDFNKHKKKHLKKKVTRKYHVLYNIPGIHHSTMQKIENAKAITYPLPNPTCSCTELTKP